MTPIKLSNKHFAETDKPFQIACQVASIPPTKRQASKWRNGKGLVWKTFKGEVT